jgi:hypothetical protein
MDIEAAQRIHEGTLLKLANVVGVGLGERDGRRVIQVMVTRKVPAETLGRDLIPREIEGHPTDVVEIGVVTAG